MPNILLIMSDEHAPMAAGCYGHPIVQTPHLDRLAREGTLFQAAYCNSPLCVPSRASFLTGKEVHRIDCWDNGAPFGSDQVTLAHLFRRAGYDTALIGKMHFIGPDQTHGFAHRPIADIQRNWVVAPDWDNGVNNPEAHTMHRRVQKAGAGRGSHNEYDDRVHETALDYLHGWAEGPRSQPFFVTVSYTAPHFPLVVPDEYFSRYYPDNVEMPAIPTGHLQQLHPAIVRLRQWFGLEHLTDEETRRARAAYYGLVTFLDEKIGGLLGALDREGLAEDTVVVYLSDHGEMAGEHGLWWKCCFYEQSVRVPLIVRWPGRFPAGRRLGEIVSLVDVARTLLEIGGVEDPGDLDGDSFLPLLGGQPIPWKNVAYSEYHAHGINRSSRMVRAGRYKLNFYTDEPSELYDLEADPGEFENLAGRPEYQSLVGELTRRVLSGWDPHELERRVRRSQRSRILIKEAEEIGSQSRVRPEIEH